jgi:hypothetical protein
MVLEDRRQAIRRYHFGSNEVTSVVKAYKRE